MCNVQVPSPPMAADSAHLHILHPVTLCGVRLVCVPSAVMAHVLYNIKKDAIHSVDVVGHNTGAIATDGSRLCTFAHSPPSDPLWCSTRLCAIGGDGTRLVHPWRGMSLTILFLSTTNKCHHRRWHSPCAPLARHVIDHLVPFDHKRAPSPPMAQRFMWFCVCVVGWLDGWVYHFLSS
jgi:hypothetical protein